QHSPTDTQPPPGGEVDTATAVSGGGIAQASCALTVPPSLGLRHPPQRQVDAAALGEPVGKQRRRPWIDAIDAVKSEATVTAEDGDVARGEVEGAGRIATLAAADAEEAAVAEGDRDHRCIEIALI